MIKMYNHFTKENYVIAFLPKIFAGGTFPAAVI